MKVNKNEVSQEHASGLYECKSCKTRIGFAVGATRLVRNVNSWARKESLSEESLYSAYMHMFRLLSTADVSLDEISNCKSHKACIALPAKQRGV